MTKTTLEKLKPVADALQTLPGDAQDLVLSEIQDRIEELGRSRLTDAQKAEVRRRLAAPAEYATEAEVSDILAKYASRR